MAILLQDYNGENISGIFQFKFLVRKSLRSVRVSKNLLGMRKYSPAVHPK